MYEKEKKQYSILDPKSKNFLLQCPEINFDILNTIHEAYVGLTSMLQGFQICIAGNPSK